VSESHQEAFDRGTAAGQITARLAEHDKHFARINGSLETMASEMHAVNLGLQGLRDEAVASRATVLTTAAALKAADDARRDKTEQSWSPMTRLGAVVASAVGVIGLGITIYLAFKGHS
jgi:hypothetical protein